MNVTNTAHSSIFRTTTVVPRGPSAAPVTITVTCTVSQTRAIFTSYTDVHCPACERSALMRLPGIVKVERHIRAHGYVPQQGRTVRCRRCRSYVEVIER